MKPTQEIINIAKQLHSLYWISPELKSALENDFPELKESEDERIRKWILDGLDFYADAIGAPEDHKKAIAYLERQKEQKPIISEDAIREGVAHFGITQYQINNWLKKHINVIEQQPAEWSDEDICILEDAITAVDLLGNDDEYSKTHPNLAKAFRVAKDWLKSLRPQPSWRPSEE